MINNFFISTLVGVLIVATVGAIIGGLILQKSAEAQGRLKTVLTESGTGYLIWRIITNLFFLALASFFAVAAYTIFHFRGFPNGVNFAIYSYLCYWYLGKLLSYNGITAYTVFDRIAVGWGDFMHWITPKSEVQVEKQIDLLEAIKHLDGKIFSDAREVKHKLANIGAPAVEPLLTALENSDKDIRKSATEVLGWIGDTRAIAPLLSKLENDEAIRVDAAASLGWIGDSGVLSLIEATKSSHTEVRDAAVFGLGQSKNILAVVPLQELLESHIRSLETNSKAIIEEACKEIIRSPEYDAAKRYEVCRNLNERSNNHFDYRAWWLPWKVVSALGSLASSCLKKKAEL